MIANYGYKDGAGEFYITVDTDRCLTCAEQACVAACPAGVLEIVEDDYEDLVCAVAQDHRKRIKYSCAPCKPGRERPPLPCVQACGPGAMTHSW